jgi:hypothetical protein
MNEPRSRLQHEQHAETQAEMGTEARQTSAHEFASAEAMIEADRELIQVPAKVAERLNRSLAEEPKPAKGWLARWLKR